MTWWVPDGTPPEGMYVLMHGTLYGPGMRRDLGCSLGWTGSDLPEHWIGKGIAQPNLEFGLTSLIVDPKNVYIHRYI